MRVRGRGRAKGRGGLRRKIKCPRTIRELFEAWEEGRRRIHLRKVMLLEFAHPDLSGQSELFRTRPPSEGVSVPGSPC